MTRKLSILFASLLASVALLVGPAVARADASTPPTPVVNLNATTPFCAGGIPFVHAVCLTL